MFLYLLLEVFFAPATNGENLWADSLKSNVEWNLQLDTAELLVDQFGATMLTRLQQQSDPEHVARVVKDQQEKLHLNNNDGDLARLSKLVHEVSKPSYPEMKFMNTRKSGQEPPDTDQKDKILRLMQQAIYETQEETLDLDKFLKVDKESPEYHFMSVLNILEELTRDLHEILTRLDRIERYQYQNDGFVDQWLYLTYYAHALKKNIDVTYIAASLVEKYRRYREDPLKHKYLKELF